MRLTRTKAGRNRARASALGAIAALAAGAGVVLGCGWNGYENSVRFNFGVTDRERQRLPPLPFKLDAKEARGAEAPGDGEDYYVRQYDEAAADQLWARAAGAAEGGELTSAAALLREFAARFAGDARANSAADQLDALSALDAGAKPEGVRAYLDARRRYDLWLSDVEAEAGAADAPQAPDARPAQEDACQAESGAAPAAADSLSELLGEPPREASLADNFAYLRAAVLYREAKPAEAADAFRDLAARFPRSEKREAALFMAARAELARTAAYLGPGASATSEEACPGCRDDAWRAAREGFARVAREYPRGRLAGEARGWLAYLALRVGDTAGALAEYYRMLADERDAGANAEALMSLRLARGRAGDAEMSLVEAELEDEPRAALAYAYHDIHNYTFGYYFTTPAPEGESYGGCQPEGWREEQDELPCQRAEARNLARVARFAARMMSRHPEAGAGAAFAVRVAQANLELGENEAAFALARRALGAGAKGAERAGALWVGAVAEYRRGDLDGARRTLARLVSEFPGGDVERAARRLLAIASEEAGDLGAALDQYLALGYDADVAYFLDVLLTPDQLASFVLSRPDHARRDELLYALGLRLMRANRYREARAFLLRVRTTAPKSPDSYDDDGDDSYDRRPEDPKGNIRHHFYEEGAAFTDGGVAAGRRESGVYADWLLRDLKTAEELQTLTDRAEAGWTQEERAEGLYQLASYLYEGSNLKFYNPAAWRGMRAEMLASLDESRYRSPGEAATVWRHAREHETLARALDIYLEVARRYPGTRAARDSLYTAALCHARLADFNAYWRRAYDELGLHAGARLVTHEDVRREYPRYGAPPAGRWEPSTRTVGGRAAWPAPPAPKKPTRAERARGQLRRAEAALVKGWALFGEVGGGRARRWSLALLCASALLLVWRSTRRSRARLYELLRRAAARREARPAVVARPRSSYAAHEPYTPGARLRDAAGRVGRTLFEVALDERGRAAIALNLLTHGLLTALLWALLWALRAG